MQRFSDNWQIQRYEDTEADSNLSTEFCLLMRNEFVTVNKPRYNRLY